MQKLTIKKQHSGKRLDKFLTDQLSEFSRSQIQKMIKEKKITVNKNSVTPHYPLKEEDIVVIEQPPTEKDILPSPALNIIYEDENLLVVDKRAGIVVHHDSVHRSGTLVDALLKKYPFIKEVGDDPERPGIVHRLDKDVSGLLAVAKNQATFTHLKKQFQQRKVKKIYTALVHGVIAKNEDKIDFYIGRTKKGKMAARPHEEGGKEAITKFEVMQRFTNYTLVKVIIKTGRTHQIRVHLNAYGFPVVGDKLYKPKKIKNKLELDRIFLHAVTLGFYDPDKQWQEFSSPLPEKLQNILNKLK